MGVSQYPQLNRFVSAATLEVRKDGVLQGRITSEKRQHLDSFGRNTFEPSTEVGIWSNLREDLYVVYAGSVNGTEEATYAITLNPLVLWVWLGAGILILGGSSRCGPGGRSSRSGAAARQAGYEAPLVGRERMNRGMPSELLSALAARPRARRGQAGRSRFQRPALRSVDGAGAFRRDRGRQ
jgi:hypothetical protein